MAQLLAAPVVSLTSLRILFMLMLTVPGCQGFALLHHSPLFHCVSLTQSTPCVSRSFPSLFGSSNDNNKNNNNDVAPVFVSLSSPREYIMQGTEQFRQGNVQGSIDSFNEAGRQLGTRPYLWQRGISLYYTDEFAAASQQFRDDVLQSPLDVEEIVWDSACLARLYPDAPFPPPNQLSLPAGKKDRRPIMVRTYLVEPRCFVTVQ
jgi:hypothetical protein